MFSRVCRFVQLQSSDYIGLALAFDGIWFCGAEVCIALNTTVL